MKKLITHLKRFETFYIIGTSTDVGKTYVGGLILNEFLSFNLNFRPLKPVETGLEENRIGPDTQKYMQCLSSHGIELASEALCKFTLQTPCSPHLSNQLENKVFKVSDIVSFVKQLGCGFIELAGGLMVPLNEKETQQDLIKSHPLPVLLVAHAGLGTLNHVLLTMAQLDSIGIKDLTIVLNFFEEGNLIHQTNYEYLSTRYTTFKINLDRKNNNI